MTTDERNALVEQWMPFAASIAREVHMTQPRPVQHCFPFEDLLQEAALLLMRAAEAWEPERGAFPTIAFYRFRGKLHRLIQANKSVIRVSTTPCVANRGAVRVSPYEEDRYYPNADRGAPSRDVDIADSVEHIRRIASQELPDTQRRVFAATWPVGDVGRTPFAEVAERVGVTTGSARELHRRGVQQIRELLTEPDENA